MAELDSGLLIVPHMRSFYVPPKYSAPLTRGIFFAPLDFLRRENEKSPPPASSSLIALDRAHEQHPPPDAEIDGGEVSFLNLPSHHSITSSARAMSVGGTSRPIVLGRDRRRPSGSPCAHCRRWPTDVPEAPARTP